jgi:OOP family OmpA-OmpF porin
MMYRGSWLFILLVLALSASAHAESGGYAAISMGVTNNVDFRDQGTSLAAGLRPALFAGSTAVNADEKVAGFKVYGGYELNRNLDIRLGYADLGKYDFSATDGVDSFDAAMTASAFFLDVVAKMKGESGWSAWGKLGLVASRAKFEGVIDGRSLGLYVEASDSYSDVGVSPGVGVAFQLTNDIKIIAEIERYLDVGGEDDIDVDLATVGIQFKFR